MENSCHQSTNTDNIFNHFLWIPIVEMQKLALAFFFFNFRPIFFLELFSNYVYSFTGLSKKLTFFGQPHACFRHEIKTGVYIIIIIFGLGCLSSGAYSRKLIEVESDACSFFANTKIRATRSFWPSKKRESQDLEGFHISHRTTRTNLQ